MTDEEALAAARYLRPEVLRFAVAMEERLRANEHKGGWYLDTVDSLTTRLYDEAEELVVVTVQQGNAGLDSAEGKNLRVRVRREAADVGNFAMMVADRSRALGHELVAALPKPPPSTLRELQEVLPWGLHTYSQAFRADVRPQRDALHAHLHIVKAAGNVAAILDDHDHGKTPEVEPDKYLADIIYCTVRVANTWPGRRIDLQSAVEKRMSEKFTPQAEQAQYPRVEAEKL